MTSRTGKPIVIADYDAAWVERFERARDAILHACPPDIFAAIEHVGSTSVPGLAAKPIVDIMPGLRSLADAPRIIEPMQSIDFEYVPEYEDDGWWGEGMPERRYFRKDLDGVRAFHVHVVEYGGEFWTKQLLFRDYLRVHPDDARRYADLKRALAENYNTTMLTRGIDVNNGYTEYKTEFIEAILARARRETSI